MNFGEKVKINANSEYDLLGHALELILNMRASTFYVGIFFPDCG